MPITPRRMCKSGSEHRTFVISLVFIMGLTHVSGCFSLRSPAGGSQATFVPPRHVNAADIAVPAGYRIEAIATGLTFPTGVAFDEKGRVYVTESATRMGKCGILHG